MNAHTRPLALITGASTGIGYELAKVIAQDGHDVVLTARSEGRLEQVAAELRDAYGVDAQVVAIDLAQAGSADELLDALGERRSRIDLLVNNAGFGSSGPFVNTDLETLLDMVQLNVTTLMRLTRLVLPGMLDRRSGGVMNVASTAAFQPGPYMAVYYATKAFVLHFSEALAEELHDRPITVTALCPGPTRTEFLSRAQIENLRLMRMAALMDARRVAEVGYRGMQKGKRVVIPGLFNRIFALSTRFVPRRLTTSVVRRLQER